MTEREPTTLLEKGCLAASEWLHPEDQRYNDESREKGRQKRKISWTRLQKNLDLESECYLVPDCTKKNPGSSFELIAHCRKWDAGKRRKWYSMSVVDRSFRFADSASIFSEEPLLNTMLVIAVAAIQPSHLIIRCVFLLSMRQWKHLPMWGLYCIIIKAATAKTSGG